MISDHDERLRALVRLVAEGPGALDARVRTRASRLAPLPEPLDAFARKLALGEAVTGADVERLRLAGYSQDQVFELAVCVAVGVAQARLAAGLRALDEAEPW